MSHPLSSPPSRRKYEQLIDDLRQDYRPQRDGGEGRGIFLVIGLLSWTGIVRVVRAEVMSLKEREFVLAARVLGATNFRIILRHILPNVVPTILILAVMSTAATILLEVGLAYLGIGAKPLPAPSWGSMIAEGQPYFISAPHIVVAPGVAIVLTVLAFNLIGQGLQEIFDPLRKDRSA